jgi:flagellar biosynthetic protein FlhB
MGLAIFAASAFDQVTMAEQDNLSEDRQLDPTERRIQKAREQGQFPQSRDLTTLLVVTVFTLALLLGGSSLSKSLLAMVTTGLLLPEHHQDWTSQLWAWLSGPMADFFGWLMALLLPVWLISILAPLALVKLQPVWAFKFNSSILNPLTGLGRMFSWQTVNEALKVAAVFGVGIAYLLSQFENLHVLTQQDMAHGLEHGWRVLRTGFTWLLIPLVVIAAIDVALRWFGFRKRMRMSVEELKQELKETEGSPEQRNRLRQRQRQMANARMMSALEKADVVLANPEHYAVALKYDAEKMYAPVVVAKGVDELALRMQAVAKDKSIPVARIPPLARMMHHQLKVGEAVPPLLFEAVAKVIAWAYDAKGKPEWDRGPLPDVGPLPESEVN